MPEWMQSDERREQRNSQYSYEKDEVRCCCAGSKATPRPTIFGNRLQSRGDLVNNDRFATEKKLVKAKKETHKLKKKKTSSTCASRISENSQTEYTEGLVC